MLSTVVFLPLLPAQLRDPYLMHPQLGLFPSATWIFPSCVHQAPCLATKRTSTLRRKGDVWTFRTPAAWTALSPFVPRDQQQTFLLSKSTILSKLPLTKKRILYRKLREEGGLSLPPEAPSTSIQPYITGHRTNHHFLSVPCPPPAVLHGSNFKTRPNTLIPWPL